jgi:septum formation protein
MLLHQKLKDTKLILGSKSPRRQALLKDLGIDFEIMQIDVEEVFPDQLQREAIPLYLSKLKASVVQPDLAQNELLITADTIVWANNSVFNKPKDQLDAQNMLNKLSGRTHEVITAVSLVKLNKIHSFYAVTEVTFKSLTEEEINYYLSNYKPFDKAGAYGIQEWIGYIGVETINGSYFNVVGLPVHDLYKELLAF